MRFTTLCSHRTNFFLSSMLTLGLVVSVACGDSESGETDEDSHGETEDEDSHGETEAGHDEIPEVDCDAVQVKGYAEMTIWDSCTGCHSSALMGDDRANAPVGVDFDSFASAMMDAEHAAGEVAAGAMPPGGGLSDAEKDELYAWARCGTPE